jgi:hypothetical protein
VLITAAYTRATAETVDLLREARLAEFQPIATIRLSTYLEPSGPFLAAEMTNVGRGPAFRLAPVVEWRVLHSTGGWLLMERSQTIPEVLPPGSEVRVNYMLSQPPSSGPDDVRREFRATVRFEDHLRNLYIQRATFVGERLGVALLQTEELRRRRHRNRSAVFEKLDSSTTDEVIFELARPHARPHARPGELPLGEEQP